MTTRLVKPVKRVTTKAYGEKIGVSGRLYGKERELIVCLMPGNLLALKPLGCSSERTVYFDLGELYRKGLVRDAFLRKMKKAEERKQGRTK